MDVRTIGIRSRVKSLPVIACRDLLCRTELPDRFDVIVMWRALALADNETRVTAYNQWLVAKAELRKRGYDIRESFDYKHNAYIASCTRTLDNPQGIS
jgi:hypothetical protein